MSMTDMSFIFLILPVASAVSFFLKGTGRELFTAFFSCLFILALSEDAFLFLIIPFFDMICFFFLRRINLGEEKLKSILNILIIKSLAFFFILEFIFPPKTPMEVSILFFDVMALCYFRISGRSMKEIDFFNYVTFFPKLFTGPYLFPRTYLRGKEKKTDITVFAEGICLFILGCGKYIILVKQIEGIFSNVFYHYELSPSVLFSWMLVILSALKIYLYISAFGDMSTGIGKMFMLSMPEAVFYPFLAPSPREFIKRISLPLNDSISYVISFFGKTLKKKDRYYLVSIISIVFINFILRPVGVNLGFSLYFTVLLLADYLLLSKLRKKSKIISGIITPVLVLPAFSFALPLNIYKSVYFLGNLFFINGLPGISESTLYFSAANFGFLIFSVVSASGIFYALSRFYKKIAPRGHSILVTIIVLAVAVMTASFALLEGGV